MAVGVSQTSIYYWSDIQAPRSEKTKTTTKAAFIALPDINTPSLSSDIQLTLTNEKGGTHHLKGFSGNRSNRDPQFDSCRTG